MVKKIALLKSKKNNFWTNNSFTFILAYILNIFQVLFR